MKRQRQLTLTALALGVAAEIALVLVAREGAQDQWQRIEFIESEQRGVEQLAPLTDLLRLQGQYRGACSAVQVSSAPTSLQGVCNERKGDIDRLFRQLLTAHPELTELAEQWREIAGSNLDGLAFFDAMTRLNKDVLKTAQRVYRVSNLQLDPTPAGYSLAALVGNQLPELVEKLGQLRGAFALVVAADLSHEEYLTEVGKARLQLEHVSQRLDELQALPGQAHITSVARAGRDIERRVSDFLNIRSAVTERDLEQLSSDAEGISVRFARATFLIDTLSEHANQLASALTSTLESRKQEIHRSLRASATAALLFQLLLVALVVALYRALARYNQAQRELETRISQQQKIFRIIGHELRTPAAALHMIAAELPHNSPDADTLRSTSNHLLHVIDDLRLTINPDDQLSSKLEDFNLLRLANELERQTGGLIASQSMRLDIDLSGIDSADVYGDVYRLRTVLSNLLRNAALHSQGSMIKLTLQSEPIDPNRIKVTCRIEDDGRGIPVDMRERVFEPFVRGASQSGGTGVGLHIARHWLEIMGGELQYTTSTLGGAGFVVTLPLEPAHSIPNVPIDAASTLLEGCEVLLVEDDAVLRKATRRVLERHFGAHVHIAENGKIALEWLRAHSAHLIITDYLMPELDGVNLLKQLRSAGRPIPAIALTAATVGDEQDLLRAAGADIVLAKPLTRDQFIDTLARLTVTEAFTLQH